MSRRLVLGAALAGLLAAAGVSVLSGATFTAVSTNPDVINASTDFVPPTMPTSAVVKTAGGDGGYVKSAGTFYVYANFADTGNPASGVNTTTATANATNFDNGTNPFALTSGSYTGDLVAYGYRSASRTVKAGLTNGSSYSWTAAVSDVGTNNAPSLAGASVTYDNVVPVTSAVSTTNGGVANRIGPGDTITYNFSEIPDREAIMPGWNGSAGAAVTVVCTNVAGPNDAVTVTGTNLGSIGTQRNYVPAGGGTWAGTIARVGTDIVVTIGAGFTATTRAGNANMAWTPSVAVTDRAGNAVAATVRTEADNDADF
jgi:hypothetical protein